MNKIPQHLHKEDNAGGIGNTDNSIATVVHELIVEATIIFHFIFQLLVFKHLVSIGL